MDLSREIQTAETRFLTKLREFFLFVLPEDKPESHGLSHHQRVWAYSKELLCYQGRENHPKKELFTHKLLIASFMHDLGMAVDRGPRHGLHSRNFCEEFLIKNNLTVKEFTDLLEAVEKHDDKEYRSSQVNNPVLRILSVADDLDALGYIGIFRYLEIYLLRKVKYEDIGNLIRNNVTSRYNNLKKFYGNIPRFIEHHNPRYEVIKNFFDCYNEQLGGYIFGTGTPAGHCGVVEMISKMVTDKMTLSELIFNAVTTNKDQVIRKFFVELSHELTPPASGIQG